MSVLADSRYSRCHILFTTKSRDNRLNFHLRYDPWRANISVVYRFVVKPTFRPFFELVLSIKTSMLWLAGRHDHFTRDNRQFAGECTIFSDPTYSGDALFTHRFARSRIQEKRCENPCAGCGQVFPLLSGPIPTAGMAFATTCPGFNVQG